MCSEMMIMKFTKDFSIGIERLKNETKNADCIVIGAGAGLSTAAASHTAAKGLKNISLIL